MRLKHIKLAGFKSFVDATQVPFPTPMTCVVGPNGCGKSNVIDAVRWVLGESSAKNLRGDAMTDVIFNGSAQRKPVSQASVELVFENTQGRISGSMADRSEISIKRVVTRDAQSLYFLNGSKCRRRDITDIFLGTGLGPRSYSIIEQGMISRLIESRPQELRVFIEEAAGISRYKERRKETETRIVHTRDNLDRLADVREELAKNIDKLRRQAATAERFKELKAAERRLKAELTGLRWYRYNEHLQRTETELKTQELELLKFEQQDSGTFAELTLAKTQLAELRQQQTDAQQRFFTTSTQIAALEQQLLHQRRRSQELADEKRLLALDVQHQLDNQQRELAQIAEFEALLLEQAPALEMLDEQVAELQQQLVQAEEASVSVRQAQRQFDQQFYQLRHQHTQLQSSLEHQRHLQLRLGQELSQLEQHDLTRQLTQLTQENQQLLQQLQQQHAEHDSEQQSLTELEADRQQRQAEWQQLQLTSKQIELEVALLTKQQQQIESQVAAIAGETRLIDALKVPAPWQAAALAVLQQLNQAQHLRQWPSDLPANGVWVEPSSVPVTCLVARPAPLAKLATLAELIDGACPQSFQFVLCAEDLSLQAALVAPWSLVTQDGWWAHVDSLCKAPADVSVQRLQLQAELQQLSQQHVALSTRLAPMQAQLLQRSAELEQLDSVLLAKRQQCQESKTQLQQLSTQVQLQAQQRQQIERLQQQHAERQQQLSDELQLLAAKIAQGELQLALLVEQLESHHATEQQYQADEQHASQLLSERRAQANALSAQLQKARLDQVSLARQLDAARLHEQKTRLALARLEEKRGQLEAQHELLSEIDPVELEEMQALLLSRDEAEQARIDYDQQILQREAHIRLLDQGQQGLVQLRQQRQKSIELLRLDAEGYRVRAANMLELLREMNVNFAELLPTLSLDADESHLQQQLEKVTDAVAKLGPINLAAIDEFTTQNERKMYLDAQHQDLVSALETLETAIRKIDRETRQKFKATFDEVNQGLQSLFPKVFGGGSAYLDLTDDDLLETGVTIMARPPGKKNSTIHLLSGGEKALTALSLVFSIFRLNPAPFCMLDEVDAPLDDANVGRFCNLVREMSDSVQFIYISHNKIAMEMAAQLMGVTMQEPGVSRVVAVDVEDAVKMAQA